MFYRWSRKITRDTSPETARINNEMPIGEIDDQGKAVTPEQVKEINVSSQARMLRLLRFTDYALVIVCGSVALQIVLDLFKNPPADISPLVIVTVIEAAVFTLGVYTALSNVGVIDPINWQSYLVAFPAILVLCVSIIGATFMEISEERSLILAVLIASGLMFVYVWIAAASLFGFVSVLLLRRTRIKALGIPLVELLFHLRSQRGVRAISVAGVKRVNAPHGLFLGLVGFGVLLGVSLVPLHKNLRASLSFFSLLGFCLLMRARRYFQVSADSLLSVDKRKPILFLRSFDDDEKSEKEKFLGADKAVLDFSLEIRLSNHFTYFGPFIAIGSPKESVPQPGAARILLSDQEWQPRVISWMNEASLIIMYSGKTQWVNWELAKIIETERVPNLILMIPEIRNRTRRKRAQEISIRIDHLRETFKDTKWRESLAAFQDFHDARAIVFDGDGSMVVIRSRPRNRESFHLAVLIAHYIILDRTANRSGA